MPRIIKSPDSDSKLALSFNLPDLVSNSLARPEKDTYEYISRKRRVGYNDSLENTETVLTSENHGFYIGKFIANSHFEKALNVFGVNTKNERIYSVNFLLASLAYLKHSIGTGEKITIFIGRKLSELLNGETDVQNAYSNEQQRDLMYKLAQDPSIRLDNEQLDVRFFEEEYLHKAVFQNLENAKDEETGIVDIDKVFANANLSFSDSPDSFQIATVFYNAVKESEYLASIFENTMPGKLADDPELPESSKYYGMFEVAIRLTEILNGRNIHGGADRQNKYDKIIESIIKGKDRRLLSIDALKPLLEIMKGFKFETIHVSTDNNYFRLKEISYRAQTRMLIYFVLFFASLFSAFQAGYNSEQKKREKFEALIDEDIEENLSDVTFYFDHLISIEKEKNVEFFNSILEIMKEEFMVRYDVDSSFMDSEFTALLKQFLINHKYVLNSMFSYKQDLVKYLDIFVKENSYYLLSKMEHKFDRPYSHFEKYMDLFEEAESTEENYSIPLMSNQYKETSAEYIGKINDGYTSYEIYIERNILDSDRILARKYFHDQNISTDVAKQAIQAYRKNQEIYDTLAFEEYIPDLYMLEENSDFSIEFDGFNVQGVIEYTDYLGRFSYEIGIYYDYDEPKDYKKRKLVARKKGEENFTSKRAFEVRNIYKELTGR